MEPSRAGTPQELEKLRFRVEQAVAELRRVNAERDRLLAISDDVRSGPDGAVPVHQAMRLQRQAVIRLREALREFETFTSCRQLVLPPRNDSH
jgi:hypothetical protein